MDVLVLQVADRRCAITLAEASEVLPAVEVHDLPGAPAGIEGVVNVRGELVPVVGLREQMGRASREVSPEEYFVLARAGGRRMILRSDTLPVLSRLPDPIASSDDEVGTAIAAVRPLDNGLVLLQDLAALLDDGRATRVRELVAAQDAGT